MTKFDILEDAAEVVEAKIQELDAIRAAIEAAP
jgi:hypothetical protein